MRGWPPLTPKVSTSNQEGDVGAAPHGWALQPRSGRSKSQPPQQPLTVLDELPLEDLEVPNGTNPKWTRS